MDKSFNCSQYQATHILKLKNTAHSFIHLFFHYQGPTREKDMKLHWPRIKIFNNNSSTNFLESLSCLITVVIYPPPDVTPVIIPVKLGRAVLSPHCIDSKVMCPDLCHNNWVEAELSQRPFLCQAHKFNCSMYGGSLGILLSDKQHHRHVTLIHVLCGQRGPMAGWHLQAQCGWRVT